MHLQEIDDACHNIFLIEKCLLLVNSLQLFVSLIKFLDSILAN